MRADSWMPPGGAVYMRRRFTFGFIGQRRPKVPHSNCSVARISVIHNVGWLWLYGPTHPEKNSSSDSGSHKSLPSSDSVAVGLGVVKCLAGCFWAVEVRAGLFRLLWILLLSNQNSWTALDTEPGADTARSRVFYKGINVDPCWGGIHFTYEFANQEKMDS